MKNHQSRKRWEVPRLLQCYLQLTAQWLNGHLLHLCCAWSDEGHTHFPPWDWETCLNAAVRHWSGRMEQNLSQPFSFTGSLHMLFLKPETKIRQARLLHVRSMRVGRISEHDRGSLQFMCIGPGVTFGKLKFVGYNCQESIPQKGTSFDVHLDVLREVGSTQLTSSWIVKEVLGTKTCLPTFWRDGKQKINSASERVGKHPPPSLLQQDCQGKGK